MASPAIGNNTIAAKQKDTLDQFINKSPCIFQVHELMYMAGAIYFELKRADGLTQFRQEKMKKKNIRLDILNKVVELENAKGHLKWKVSDLARLSKVSRPLIYYHFGKTKREILISSLEIVASEYFGLNEERINMLKAGKGWDSVLQTREMFLATPSFATFYLKWRMTRSPLQEIFIRIEKQYQESLQQNFPHFSKAKVVALHAILQGVVTAPFLTPDALDEIFELTKRL